MNVELELLVSRLRWPIASTRWWAMQELSQLLQLPELREAASTRLLDELRSCRLEAEVVEVLFIFWMAAMRGYAPPPDLPEAVNLPSLLASVLLDEMGLRSSQVLNPPLQVGPSDFDVPSNFFDIQGSQVPRIYLTRLERLESYSGLPFVHQCGFEWSENQLAYPDAPFQGDLTYFIRPIGEGMTGAFPSRTMLRMLSAYQRTLAVAQQHWRAPGELMRQFALEALPINPTLAFLRPFRPSWLPALGQHIGADSAAVEAFIRGAVHALQTEDSNAALLSLATPTYVSRDEFVELTVVRWRQWSTSAINSEVLEARFRARIDEGVFGRCKAAGLGVRTALPVLALDAVTDEESQAAPMAAVQGIDRLGYLQRDLYPERLYYPVVTGAHKNLSVEPVGDQLSVSSDLGQLATVHYWNSGWAPVHPASMGALCGTALVGARAMLPDMGEASPLRHFYLWRLKRLKRPSGYGNFDVGELTGTVFE